jgi:hypothetical protein
MRQALKGPGSHPARCDLHEILIHAKRCQELFVKFLVSWSCLINLSKTDACLAARGTSDGFRQAPSQLRRVCERSCRPNRRPNLRHQVTHEIPPHTEHRKNGSRAALERVACRS